MIEITLSCPTCKARVDKIIYAGLPMKLCSDPDCSRIFGLWSFAADWIGFNGVMVCYEGSYGKALWHWLVDDME